MTGIEREGSPERATRSIGEQLLIKAIQRTDQTGGYSVSYNKIGSPLILHCQHEAYHKGGQGDDLPLRPQPSDKKAGEYEKYRTLFQESRRAVKALGKSLTPGAIVGWLYNFATYGANGSMLFEAIGDKAENRAKKIERILLSSSDLITGEHSSQGKIYAAEIKKEENGFVIKAGDEEIKLATDFDKIEAFFLLRSSVGNLVMGSLIQSTLQKLVADGRIGVGDIDLRNGLKSVLAQAGVDYKDPADLRRSGFNSRQVEFLTDTIKEEEVIDIIDEVSRDLVLSPAVDVISGKGSTAASKLVTVRSSGIEIGADGNGFITVGDRVELGKPVLWVGDLQKGDIAQSLKSILAQVQVAKNDVLLGNGENHPSLFVEKSKPLEETLGQQGVIEKWSFKLSNGGKRVIKKLYKKLEELGYSHQEILEAADNLRTELKNKGELKMGQRLALSSLRARAMWNQRRKEYERVRRSMRGRLWEIAFPGMEHNLAQQLVAIKERRRRGEKVKLSSYPDVEMFMRKIKNTIGKWKKRKKAALQRLDTNSN